MQRITEDELVDAYGSSNAEERFDLIYENYSVFPQLVDCFEIGLFNTILNEKEYNRRAKNSADFGVAREAKAVYKIDHTVLVNCEIFEKFLEGFRE